MMQTWMPGAKIVRPRNTSAPSFVGPVRWKVCIHTTESTRGNQGGSQNYHGHQSYPHFEVEVGKGITQFFPLDVAGKALANDNRPGETNRAYVIQIECVWRAANEDWPEELLNLVAQVIAFVHRQTGMELDCLDFLGDDDGFRLAYEGSHIRRNLTNYSGVCGHQHFPENTHWDPGHLPYERLMDKVHALVGRPTPAPDPAQETFVPGTTVLTFAHSSLVLDVAGQQTADGAPVVQWPLTGRGNQLVRFEDAGNGWFHLLFEHSGKALDWDPNAKVLHQWTKMVGNPNQHWKIETVIGNVVALINKHGVVIDVPDIDRQPGARVSAWEWNGGPNQLIVKTAC